jgi:hypothetical protein
VGGKKAVTATLVKSANMHTETTRNWFIIIYFASCSVLFYVNVVPSASLIEWSGGSNWNSNWHLEDSPNISCDIPPVNTERESENPESQAQLIKRVLTRAHVCAHWCPHISPILTLRVSMQWQPLRRHRCWPPATCRPWCSAAASCRRVCDDVRYPVGEYSLRHLHRHR